ncbi:DNA-binding transcriptional MerR regulator [Actinoalloteichus hoggarensis]|uniref:Nodulation protein NolA n=1 Tax=Actinoalloteichus hoggarensis TaxID=1470176 RepID=A0A221WCD5_9PSEU|nr:MerR family transcriptional regulator [Actinoalloteichus hoggarensis]ASO23149.1 Nodulation protein NolA [Actinoalloteichus hoggarensis]MBB5922753.1 DNA-binding transcriptional MerR regulator [Actinoalloteichus hoggarensis]
MDDNELYPIGDAARRTGLSVSAIRFYSDAGITPPAGHTSAGHRLYDVESIARLELVRTLRELGAGLDDIRSLLAEETTLHDLAITHLGIVERQTHRLQVRRAVLRTIVRQHSATERIGLMHKLASMSDDDRDRLIDEFWDEVSEDLPVHPGYITMLHQMRPTLPEEPTTEQLEAWLELADMVRDADFRREVRQFFHDSFAGSSLAQQVTSPAMLKQIEKHGLIMAEVGEARRSGMPVDSPAAGEIVERLVVATAEVTAEATGEYDVDETRRHLTEAPEDHSEPTEAAERFTSRFTSVLDRYLTLTATISGGPQPDPDDGDKDEKWIAAVLAHAAANRVSDSADARADGVTAEPPAAP